MLRKSSNWGFSQAEALVGAAVVLEDEALFETSLALLHVLINSYFYSFALDGDLPPPLLDKQAGWNGVFNASTDGVSRETCRDLGHVLYAIAAGSNAAETAWLQGERGLWATNAQRWTATVELHAAMELELSGFRQPVARPLCGGRAVKMGDDISLRPQYPTLEVVYAALNGRLGLNLPAAKEYLQRVTRADPHPVDTGKSVGHMIVFETLTVNHGSALDPPLRVPPAPALPGSHFCLPADKTRHCYDVQAPLSQSVLADNSSQRPAVTLLIHSSLSKLGVVRGMLGAWRGPSSVVLYAQDKTDAQLLRSFKCTNCVLSVVVARREGAPYPINLLRQLAVSVAATDACMLIDADFFPSLSTYGSVRLAVPIPIPPRSVFVVPAFQNIAPDTNSVGSVSLEMLIQEWEKKNVQVFHGNSATV